MSLGDSIGKKFNMLTILEEYRKDNKTYCKCQCDCGNVKENMLKDNITRGKSKSCGCVNKKYKEIKIGDVFSRLTVIEENNKIDNTYIKYWICKCECGNIVKVRDINLKTNKTQSCGCYQYETRIKNCSNNKKYNKYNLNGDYGIGYTTKGEEFYFDLDDYDKIKNICWNINNDGYVYSIDNKNHKTILMHRIIMNIDNSNYTMFQVDHKFHNKKDNRKENLRICSAEENARNKKITKSNSSGIIGVYPRENTTKWRAIIGYKKERIILGQFNTKEEAIVARLKAEKKYYGDFAPQSYLFKEYRIEE